jgi:hypothetical protein
MLNNYSLEQFVPCNQPELKLEFAYAAFAMITSRNPTYSTRSIHSY